MLDSAEARYALMKRMTSKSFRAPDILDRGHKNNNPHSNWTNQSPSEPIERSGAPIAHGQLRIRAERGDIKHEAGPSKPNISFIASKHYIHFSLSFQFFLRYSFYLHTHYCSARMKISTLILCAGAQVATAHYFFDTNIVGGVQQPAFKYVRQSSRAVKYNPIKFSSNPAADIRDGSTADGPDIVCNQGAFASAGKTEVLTVNAGEEVRLKLAVGAKFQHPGPGLVYMSKAPTGSVKAYDGSGDWFKIFEEGVCDGGDFTSTAWCDYNRDWIAVKIPKDTPNGEYLLRAEHIGVHRSHVNQPEHYVSCMQIKVQGGGSGTPGPMVKVSYASTNF
jgi:hypothetical protein